MKNNTWTFITAVVVALVVSGSAVFISLQYNQTQKDIANTQAQAQKESADKVGNGLSDIGEGVCQTRASGGLGCQK